MKFFLYTNFSRYGRIRFRDLLPVSRPFGSNESEQEIEDPSEIAYWGKILDEATMNTADLLGGKRYYFSAHNSPD